MKQERKIAVKLLDVLHRDLNEVSEVKTLRISQKQPAELTGPPGLTSREAQRLLEKNGKNQLVSGKRISAFKIFISQFKDILVIILLIILPYRPIQWC